MKYKVPLIILTTFLLSGVHLYAQEAAQNCKVMIEDLVGTYAGGCKDGYAHGKGTAQGTTQKYVGNFTNGLPNGEGIYYYSDKEYHKGKFQDGIREGKGEAHYLRKGLPDSVVKGYWSGDEYRGKNYTTYRYSGGLQFDRVEIEPSAQSGRTLTIEISVFPSAGGSVTINELFTTDGSFVRRLDGYTTTNKSTITYELSHFPVTLQAVLSTGQIINLELYKNARWMARFWLLK